MTLHKNTCRARNAMCTFKYNDPFERKNLFTHFSCNLHTVSCKHSVLLSFKNSFNKKERIRYFLYKKYIFCVKTTTIIIIPIFIHTYLYKKNHISLNLYSKQLLSFCNKFCFFKFELHHALYKNKVKKKPQRVLYQNNIVYFTINNLISILFSLFINNKEPYVQNLEQYQKFNKISLSP